MNVTIFNEKENTLYILTDAIMCDTKGMTKQEARKARNEHFKLSYEWRIELSKYKEQIKAEIAKHPNCEISEYIEL